MKFNVQYTLKDEQKETLKSYVWEIDDEIKYSNQPKDFKEIVNGLLLSDIALLDNCTITIINKFDRVIITPKEDSYE